MVSPYNSYCKTSWKELKDSQYSHKAAYATSLYMLEVGMSSIVDKSTFSLCQLN